MHSWTVLITLIYHIGNITVHKGRLCCIGVTRIHIARGEISYYLQAMGLGTLKCTGLTHVPCGSS